MSILERDDCLYLIGIQGSHFVCRRKSPPVGGDFRRETKCVTCRLFIELQNARNKTTVVHSQPCSQPRRRLFSELYSISTPPNYSTPPSLSMERRIAAGGCCGIVTLPPFFPPFLPQAILIEAPLKSHHSPVPKTMGVKSNIV